MFVVNDWISLAASANGVKLAAVSKSGDVYVSNTSGASWSPRRWVLQSSIAWASITSSADGTKLALAAFNQNGVYTSNNSGTTWTLRSSGLPSGPTSYMSIASSEDGTKLAVVVQYGGMYTSSDSGASWTLQSVAGTKGWLRLTMSSNGSKLAACASDGILYTSGDGGQSLGLPGHPDFPPLRLQCGCPSHPQVMGHALLQLKQAKVFTSVPTVVVPGPKACLNSSGFCFCQTVGGRVQSFSGEPRLWDLPQHQRRIDLGASLLGSGRQ